MPILQELNAQGIFYQSKNLSPPGGAQASYSQKDNLQDVYSENIGLYMKRILQNDHVYMVGLNVGTTLLSSPG